jgi:DNA-binding CsgD family transcriptional regulator
MGLSTAESHVKHICHKLGAATRGEAVFRAYRLGLISLDGHLLVASGP